MSDINPNELKPRKPEEIPVDSKVPKELKPIVNEYKLAEVTVSLLEKGWYYTKIAFQKVSDVVSKTYETINNLSGMKSTVIWIVVALVLVIAAVLIAK